MKGTRRWDEAVSGSYTQFGLTEAIRLRGLAGRKQKKKKSLTRRRFGEKNTLTWVWNEIMGCLYEEIPPSNVSYEEFTFSLGEKNRLKIG